MSPGSPNPLVIKTGLKVRPPGSQASLLLWAPSLQLAPVPRPASPEPLVLVRGSGPSLCLLVAKNHILSHILLPRSEWFLAWPWGPAGQPSGHHHLATSAQHELTPWARAGSLAWWSGEAQKPPLRNAEVWTLCCGCSEEGDWGPGTERQEGLL